MINIEAQKVDELKLHWKKHIGVV